jgi:hypothetical protein
VFYPARLVAIEEGVDLSLVGRMAHLKDPATGLQFLRLEDQEIASYPTPQEEDILDFLLLPVTAIDGDRYIHLPETYCTFAQSLDNIANTAAKTAESSEGVITEGGLLRDAKTLFGILGSQLDDLALGDGVLPEDLHIRQVLLMEGDGELQIKLLPPLKLRPVEDEIYTPADTRTMLLQRLYNSCWGVVTNPMVRATLPAAFKELTETFSVGRASNDVSQSLGRNTPSSTSASS